MPGYIFVLTSRLKSKETGGAAFYPPGFHWAQRTLRLDSLYQFPEEQRAPFKFEDELLSYYAMPIDHNSAFFQCRSPAQLRPDSWAAEQSEPVFLFT